MAINKSKAKGTRAEAALKKVLVEKTKLKWERTPQSGALGAQHGLKGDLYIPNEKNYYCVEVKHYKDDKLTSKILTDKTPQILEWWDQTVREAEETGKDPILFFKFDRSKWFVSIPKYTLVDYGYDLESMPGDGLYWSRPSVVIYELNEFFKNLELQWIAE